MITIEIRRLVEKGLAKWSFKFPDQTPLDFFWCGHLKLIVFKTLAKSFEQL